MQTPQDFSTTARRPMDVEDYIDMLRRHRAWILGPVFIALVVSVVVAFLWPDTFVAYARIRVTPPQVPERLVPTNLNMEMSQRIQAMSETILSRSVLTAIITNYDLFKSQRQRGMLMEDLIDEMAQRRIKITPMSPLQQGGGRVSSAFQISFAYSDRYLAKKVADDLVARFMDANVQDRTRQTLATTDFLTGQLETARRNLDEIEAKQTEFRIRNAGRLPDQLGANLQQMNALQTQLSTLNNSMNRATQDKLLFETQLKTFNDQKNALLALADETLALGKSERLVQLERQVQNLETNLAALREHYKDSHPDIQRAQADLGFLKRTREMALREDAQRKPPPPPRRTPAMERDIKELEGNVARLRALMTTKELELAEIVKEQSQIDKMLKSYQQRVDASPLGEQAYSELMRDRELAKRRYEELSQKQSMSQTATDQETRRLGELMEVLDPTTLPQTPTEPKRYMIISVGTGLGLLLGVFLAGGREMKDTTLKNLKDVRAYTKQTVLGSVPLLEDDFVVRRRRRMAWLVWSTVVLVGILIMSGSVVYYTFYVNKAVQ